MQGSFGRFRVYLLMTSCMVVASAGAALAQDGKPADKPPTPDPKRGAAPKDDDEMAAAMAAMTPGPVHERLMKLAGEWETETRMEMAGQDPTATKGTAIIKAELGGRFLHETGSGEMMGMLTQHFKLWGYNNGSKKYESVWTWTMSTSLLHLSGESKDDGKAIEWVCSFDNETGKREDFKATTTFVDDDHFKIKLYGGKMPDGSEGPTMYVDYSRKN